MKEAAVMSRHQQKNASADRKVHPPQSQDVPAGEVKKTRAGTRGVQHGGNAGAMGDPVSDQSQHNYQVSRDTDMTQHAEMVPVQGSRFDLTRDPETLNIEP
jgi:hypothetical protein